MKEIVLTGVNIGDFGKTTGETFYELIQELDNVDGIDRYRISSIEPNLLTSEIIEFVAGSKKFLPHFHIPLQSGSDKMLTLMKRRYNTNLFKKRIETIRNLMPNAAIGVDVIVGFPDERNSDFEITYNFIDSLDVSYLHVFSYSERPNTDSINIFPKVNSSDIAIRSKKLHVLSDKKRRIFYQENIGKEFNVLFEAKKSNGIISGFTENYIKTVISFNEKLINSIEKVKLIKLNEHGDVVGTLV